MRVCVAPSVISFTSNALLSLVFVVIYIIVLWLKLFVSFFTIISTPFFIPFYETKSILTNIINNNNTQHQERSQVGNVQKNNPSFLVTINYKQI